MPQYYSYQDRCCPPYANETAPIQQLNPRDDARQ